MKYLMLMLLSAQTAVAAPSAQVAIEALSKSLALPRLGGSLETADERIVKTDSKISNGVSEVVFTVQYKSYRDLNSGCDDVNCQPSWQETQCAGTVTVRSDIVSQNPAVSNITCK